MDIMSIAIISNGALSIFKLFKFIVLFLTKHNSKSNQLSINSSIVR